MLDLVSQVRDVVLLNVHIFGSGKLREVGILEWGYMSQGREMGSLVHEQPGYEVDGSYHSKEGSK